MNPLTNVKNIQKLNKLELEVGATSKTSWHSQYKDSAWVFIGGLPYDLSEGDILAVFSQYGEIVNLNLVRDKGTGKSKGFAFLCYEDQRSTILAVDNLNSMKILGRTLRVDHCEKYRKPKETGEEDDLTQQLRAEGCAPKTPSASESEGEDIVPAKKVKKEKKEKKKKKDKKKEKKKKKIRSESGDSDYGNNQSQNTSQPIRVKTERVDPGYDKYTETHNHGRDSDFNAKDSTKIKKERSYRNREDRALESDNIRDSKQFKKERDYRLSERDVDHTRKRNRDEEDLHLRNTDNGKHRDDGFNRSRDSNHAQEGISDRGERRGDNHDRERRGERTGDRQSDRDRSWDYDRSRDRIQLNDRESHRERDRNRRSDR